MRSAPPSLARPFLLAGVLTIVASSCQPDDPVFSTGVEQTETAVPAVRQGWTVASLPDEEIFEDERMLALARELPTFGGYYYDSRDREQLVVALTDTNDLEVAEPLVYRQLDSGRRADRAIPRRPYAAELVDYPFLELARYRTVLRQEVFEIPGVVSIGVKESANQVTVGVESASAEDAVRALMVELGVPAGVVSFPRVAPIRPASSTRGSPHIISGFGSLALTDEHPDGEIEGAWQIDAGSGNCSLGFPALRASDSLEVFVMASHCTGIEHAPDSGFVYQNAALSGGSVVGVEILDPQHTCGTNCVEADAALVEAQVAINFGEIARTTESSGCEDCDAPLTINGAPSTFSINGRDDHVIENETLQKVGQRTGWTYGAVESTCDDYDSNPVENCGDRVDFSTKQGDSGAPVFKWVPATGEVELRGIVTGRWCFLGQFSCDGVMSDLHQIEEHFGDDLLVWENPLQVSIVGPDEVPSEISCLWTVDVDGGTFPYSYDWRVDGQPAGSSQLFEMEDTGTEDFELGVIVTDAATDDEFDILEVTVGSGPPCPPPGQ